MKTRQEQNFRLAAIDIDGTLTGHDGQVSQANLRAVQRLREGGLEVVLASGRSQANMMPYHELLGLTTPLVSANGAVVGEAGAGAPYSTITLHAQTVQRLTLEGHQAGVAVAHYRADGVFLDRRNAQTDYDQTRCIQPQTMVPDLLLQKAPVHKVIWMGPQDLLATLLPRAQRGLSLDATIYPTEPGYLEFMAPTVSKAAGLEIVAQRFGIHPSQIMAFGDGNNDLQMLSWAGLGVAMGHATPAAKAAAHRVGPEGPAETALARAIELAISAIPTELVASSQ